jgi:hypothetical protein
VHDGLVALRVVEDRGRASLASCGTGAASPAPLSSSARFPSRADRTVSPTDAEQVVAVLAQMVLPLAA